MWELQESVLLLEFNPVYVSKVLRKRDSLVLSFWGVRPPVSFPLAGGCLFSCLAGMCAQVCASSKVRCQLWMRQLCVLMGPDTRGGQRVHLTDTLPIRVNRHWLCVWFGWQTVKWLLDSLLLGKNVKDFPDYFLALWKHAHTIQQHEVIFPFHLHHISCFIRGLRKIAVKKQKQDEVLTFISASCQELQWTQICKEHSCKLIAFALSSPPCITHPLITMYNLLVLKLDSGWGEAFIIVLCLKFIVCNGICFINATQYVYH